MATFTVPVGHPAARRRSSPHELLSDAGRFAVVAGLLLAVLATTSWPAQPRRTQGGAGGSTSLPGNG